MVRQAAEVTLCISERLPNYLAAAQDVIMPCEEDKVKWWRQQSDNLPHWSSAVMKVLLVQPSSAAAERVFSILNSSFNDSQEHALADYLQACVLVEIHLFHSNSQSKFLGSYYNSKNRVKMLGTG